MHLKIAKQLPKVAVAMAVLTSLSLAAQAATHQVTTNSDNLTPDGICSAAGTGDGCSLREAITVANSNADASTITFATGISGPRLNAALPDLASRISIVGNSARTTGISPGSEIEAAVLTIAPNKTVDITGMRIGGYRGILNQGVLTMRQCAMISSTFFKTENHEPTERGGALVNRGSAVIENSIFQHNRAYSGGAISNQDNASLVLRQCTFDNNLSTGRTGWTGGGAIENVSLTGISAPETRVFIDSCTVVESSMDSGAATLGGTIVLNTGTVTIRNSIIGSFGSRDIVNRATSPGDGKVVNAGYNLIGNNSTVATEFPAGTPNGTSYVGSATRRLEVLTGMFGPDNHGGPTDTWGINSESLAFNHGLPSLTATSNDQRGPGFPRVVNGRADIGAFEYQNRIPVAAGPSSFTAVVNTPKTVTLQGTDEDQEPLEYFIASLPTRGSLYDGATTTTEITTFPYRLTDPGHRVTLVSPSVGSGSFAFTVRDPDFAESARQTVAYTVVSSTTPVISFDAPMVTGATIGSLPAPITGTYSVPSGNANLSSFQLRLSRFNNGVRQFYKPGTGWGSAVANISVRPNTANGTFASSVPLPTDLPNGAYGITGIVKDTNLNIGSASVAFTIDNATTPDTVAPTVTVNGPIAPDAILTAMPAAISGTVQDNRGPFNVARLFLRLSRFVTVNNATVRQFWNPGNSTWTAASAPIITTAPTRPSTSGQWTAVGNLPTGSNATNGRYALNAIATDTAGNTGAATIVFHIQAAGVVVRTSVALSNATAGRDGSVILTFTGPLAASAADISAYTGAVNGQETPIRSASLSEASMVVLQLGTLKAGDQVAVGYSVVDSSKRSVQGTATTRVK